MKIRVELASGRSIEGDVVSGDAGPIRRMFDYLDVGGQPMMNGWIRLLDDEARPHGVNLAHAETITELPE